MPGFKLWTTNELLTSSDVNGYLMRQAIAICTSGTRPSSPVEGQHIYETDNNAMQKYNGSAWEPVGASRNSFTPTLGAATTPPTMGTGAVRNSYYSLVPGPYCVYTFHILFGSSGVSAGSGNYNVSLPISPAAPYATGNTALGTCLLADQSTGFFKVGTLFLASGSSTLGLIVESTTIVSNSAPWTWAAGDYITGSIAYPVS